MMLQSQTGTGTRTSTRKSSAAHTVRTSSRLSHLTNISSCSETTTTAPSIDMSLSSMASTITNTKFALTRMTSSKRRLFKTKQQDKHNIRTLIEKRSWRIIHRHLGSSAGISQVKNEPLPLHLAIQKHAPLDIIQLILLHNPGCIQAKDTRERNVLHVAAMSWAEPEIIEYLLDIHQELAYETDRDGRSPLHLLLVPAAEIGATQLRKISSYHSPSPSSIQHLIKAAPKTVNEEDDFETSPIEYALCSNKLHICVVQLMRRASEDQWKQEEILKDAAATQPSITSNNKPSARGLMRQASRKARRRNSLSATSA